MIGKNVYVLMSMNVDDEFDLESVHATMEGLNKRKQKLIKERELSKEEAERYFEDYDKKIQE